MNKLYLIPTPLSDTNQQFLLPQDQEIISKLSVFIVETPKKARAHLKILNMVKPIQDIEMHILDEHTRYGDVVKLAKLLKEGDVGLMSDAGAPGIADPGAKLVRLAHATNIEVVPLVGPSSIFLALMASGLNGQKFRFNGYLPVDRTEREKSIISLESASKKNDTTQIFMETPYRNIHIWKDLLRVCEPDTEICVALDLHTENQLIRTATTKDWQNLKWPDLEKKPAIFMIYSRVETYKKPQQNKKGSFNKNKKR